MPKHSDYKLMTIPGVDIATASKPIAEIGGISRSRNADKLAGYAGIAPVAFSSAGNGKDEGSRQGNRQLHGLLYFLAVGMAAVPKTGKPNGEAESAGVLRLFVNAERIGAAAAKSGPGHRAASFLTQEQLASGQTFITAGGDGVNRTLLQATGEMDGKTGISEYILTPEGYVSHQRSIANGITNGAPNQIVKL